MRRPSAGPAPLLTPHSAVRRRGTQNANQSSLREANLHLVAATVFASSRPISRADVAAATSMTRSTISRLADDLVAGGFFVELDPPTVSGPGRPATPLVPAPRRYAALGLQVNPGFLATALLDLNGDVLATRYIVGDYAGSDPAVTLASLAELARDTLTELPGGCRLTGIGLALPGIVDTGRGLLLRGPNLGWSEVDVHEHLGDLTPALPPAQVVGFDGIGSTVGRPALDPVRVGNEADLAALTIAMVAPGRRGAHGDFLYVSGEIGIGGAAVHDAEVHGGCHGWAGEVGHVCVDPEGPSCRCGSTGCLEQYAGRRALLEAAGIPDGTPTQLNDLARSGDPRALAAVAAATRALSVALASVVNIVDIPTVVLGGHLSELGVLIKDDLEEALRARVLSAGWVAPRIVIGADEPASGARGAALRELADVLRDPARYIDA